MSAAPRIHESAPAAAPEFYGRIAASPWARGDLSNRAKVVYGALAILSRGSQTWVEASIERIALTCGLTARTARQGLAELTEKGVISWESIGHRFVILFRLRGRESAAEPPAPRLAPDPNAYANGDANAYPNAYANASSDRVPPRPPIEDRAPAGARLREEREREREI